MRRLHQCLLRIKTLFSRRRSTQQLDDELQFHLDQQTAEYVSAGMDPEEAHHAAMRTFGNRTVLKEQTMDAWGSGRLDDIGQDLRYGFRALRKNPAFCTVAILTLALGIGANTAMFSLLDQIVLRLLPVDHPEQLVIIRETGNHFANSYGANTVSWPMFEDLRDNNQVFSGMFCRFPTTVTIGYLDQPAQVRAELVSASYFSTLGVGAALGRTIAADDDTVPDSRPVVVLSYSFWRNYFAGDRTIVGRTIALNDQTMTVIGVAQPGFDGVALGAPAKVFVPIMMKTEMTPHSDGLKDRRRRLDWVTAYGRLKPGIGVEQAQRSLQPLMQSILRMEAGQPEFTRSAATAADRDVFLRNRAELLSGSENGLREDLRKPLWLLVALTAAVLLLACANLANLLLARAIAREREFAVRMAIGAGKARLVRQLLVESLLLAGAGAALGLALAFLVDRVLLRMYLPADAAAAFEVTPIPDGRVLVFIAGLMCLTSLAFGLLPAVRSSRTELTLSLKDRSGAASTSGHSLRRMLVAVQVGVSVLLLFGAGLFVRTLRNLESLGPGFPTDHLLAFSVDPSLNGYSDEATKSFYERLDVNLHSMPGVTSVGFSALPILKGYAWQNAVIGKDFQGAPIEEQPVLNTVNPDYFAALGIPIIAGRAFTARDDAGSSGDASPLAANPLRDFAHAVINESFAKRYFAGRNPVGQRFGLVNDARPADQAIEVVGVIPDRKVRDLREAPPAQAYFPYLEDPHFRFMNVYLRTQRDPREVESALRERMRRFDPRVPIVALQTVNEQIGVSLRTERLVASLSAVFGGLATLLAAIGLYGVVAYTVNRRTREFGLRVALGALQRDVVWLVMRDVLTLIAAGLALGVPLMLALSTLVRSQIFGLGPHDPLTLVSSTLGLGLVACLAGLIPALRAGRVDPLQSIRLE